MEGNVLVCLGVQSELVYENLVQDIQFPDQILSDTSITNHKRRTLTAWRRYRYMILLIRNLCCSICANDFARPVALVVSIVRETDCSGSGVVLGPCRQKSG